MTTTLVLDLPLGRWHPIPFGRDASGSCIELPPSPWRLLRALHTVWRERVPELDEHSVLDVLSALTVPPVMFVPRYRIERADHGDAADVVSVFDSDAALAVQWRDVVLSHTQRAVLERLARSVHYLGRADNLCDARVVDDWLPPAHDRWIPLPEADWIPDNVTTTTCLVPRRSLLREAVAAGPAEVDVAGLPRPVGTALIAYQRVRMPTHCRARNLSPSGSVSAVRFDMVDGSCPLSTDALAYTDLLRLAALSQLGKRRPERKDTVLGGKSAAAEKATDNHGHAHYLPLVRDESISGLIVWAPNGLVDDELEALFDVRTLWSTRNKRWCAGIRATKAGDLGSVAPELCGTSYVWESVTPFAPSMHHFKKSWDLRQIMQRGVARELRYRGMDDVTVDVEVRGSGRNFLRQRLTKHSGNKPIAALRLRMDRPATGPLSLGHLSHFGLGLFAPQ